MSVIIITCLNKIILPLINYSLLYRFESQDNVMMADVGEHLVKFYMDPFMYSDRQYSFMEIVVIGLILRNQFLNVKV